MNSYTIAKYDGTTETINADGMFASDGASVTFFVNDANAPDGRRITAIFSNSYSKVTLDS